MTSPYPSPPFNVPSPSESSFSIPTTSEPVFSVATTEPVFESHTSHSAQPSQNTQHQFQQYNSTTVSSSNAKFPYLKKDEYETWAMKMEYWIMNSDHNLWNIVLHGNSRKRTGRDPRGNIMILPPVTMEEQIAVQRETKARTILLQSLPEDHMADFHHLDDAKDIWLAVKARFGGNEESKKMRKSMLKQEFADFKISESEGLHKGYDRFQKVLSQLNQMQARPDNEDCNMKFLRALPPSWSQVAITLKTKGGLDFLSFDDLYNKLRTLEIDVKGGSSYDSRVPAAPTHSAFISAASTNSKWSTADSKCQPSSVSYTTTSSSADASGNVLENVLHSFVAESDPQQQITYEDFDQIGKLDLEELDIKWQMAMLSVRINRFEKKAGRKFKFNNKDAARFDKKKVRCYQCSELGHFARECTGKKVDSKTRYSQFKIKELDKSEEPKALVSVDSMLNWSDHESEDMEKGASEVYGMIAGYGDDAVIPAVDAADGVSTDGIFADGVFVATGNGSDGVSVAAGVGADGVSVTSSDATDAETQFALMGLSPQVQSCPFGCNYIYTELKKDFDNLEVQYKECFIQVQAYKSSLQNLEQQKSWYQNNQLALEEKIRILTADLGNTTNMLKYTEKLNEQAKIDNMNNKVKLEESEARFDKWKNSSKNLNKLINSSMSSRSKFGLGYGDTFGSDEVFDLSAPSIFDSCLKDAIEKPLYDGFVKAGGLHAVPGPITGTFMPPSNKPDIDDTQFTYGSKSNNSSETNSVSNDFVSCPKALVSVDSMLNWSDHESEDMEKGASEVYGMIAGYGDDTIIPTGDASDGGGRDSFSADGVFVAAGNGSDGVSVAAGVGADSVSVASSDATDAETEFALMGLSPQVQSCPFDCNHIYTELKKEFDNLEVQYKECFLQVQAYKSSLQNLEQQKSWYQNNQLALEEKIRILTADLGNTTNMLKYTEKLNEQAKLDNMNTKVKLEESNARFDKWKESSKNLVKLINSSMSSRSKFGLGYGDTFGSDEVFDLSAPSIFDSCLKDAIEKPLYDWFVKPVGMHAVPPPITGTFMPPSNKPDIDDTQFTYGSKSNNYVETNSISNDFISCDNSDKSSDSESAGFASCASSVNSSSTMTNASSSVDLKNLYKTDDQGPSNDTQSPSFSFKKNVKTPRNLCNRNGSNNISLCKNKSFRVKNCFVCGSKFHLIRDCDFYENQLRLNNTPVWKNVENIPSFVPRPAYVPTGSRNRPRYVIADRLFPAGSRNRPTSVPAGRSFPTGWHNPATRPMTRPKIHYFQQFSGPGSYNQMAMDEGRWGTDNPHTNKDIGIVDSGCSRSMTGNKEKLADFMKIKGGTVTFGGGDGKITRKGTIRTSNFNFENVCYVEELQNFNLFSVLQICDTKNKVLFTDSECLVLSKEFELPDSSQVVLRVPRRHNLYCFNLTDIHSEREIKCLLAKASLDESTKWHRRMAHVNFKNINKLAKHGLVNGLPSKLFTNEHNCVTCNKGKQHKASYKAITAVSTISEPL
ncbi:putative ribonuclease H-like domain-containing protein [Tanacetum coccineum]